MSIGVNSIPCLHVSYLGVESSGMFHVLHNRSESIPCPCFTCHLVESSSTCRSLESSPCYTSTCRSLKSSQCGTSTCKLLESSPFLASTCPSLKSSPSNTSTCPQVSSPFGTSSFVCHGICTSTYKYGDRVPPTPPISGQHLVLFWGILMFGSSDYLF